MEATSGAKLPSPMDFSGNMAENFKKFKQNFEIYLLASNKRELSSEIKVAILLNCMGQEGVNIYNNLKFATADDKNDYDKVMKQFEIYANPRKNIIYERFVFFSRKQEEGESIDHFVNDLKKLAQSCEFDKQEESLIRDRIVLGMNDLKLQERLLTRDDLSLDKAVAECRVHEVSAMQIRNLQDRSVNQIKGNYKKYPEEIKNTMKKAVTSTEKFLCYRCKEQHGPKQCKAYGKKCAACGLLNHFAKACRIRKVREINKEEEIQDSEDDDLKINNITVSSGDKNKYIDKSIWDIGNNSKAWFQNVKICNNNLKFKLDTGSEVNILPLGIYKKYLSDQKLKSTNIMLEAYGGFKIKPLGNIIVNGNIRNKYFKLSFIVADVKSTPILGLQACIDLGFIKCIDEVKLYDGKEKFIENNKDVFEGLGKFKEKCKIILKNNYRAVAKPARRIPISLRERLKEKLNELESKQVISKVEHPKEWVSNLVIIEKTDGSLRLCLDPQDLNKAIQRQFFTIPTIEDISYKLCGKSYFTVLDLKDGFYQIELEDRSSEYCTFSTIFGCYKFNRLPFGVSNAPEYFQKCNEANFGDIPGVVIYFDDILIAANTSDEHDEILNAVVKRAKYLNIKFNKNKVQYKINEVKYMGHIFCKEGMKPDKDRVKAIKCIQNPTNLKELQRILGMVNYLRRFIPNFAAITSPLRELLKKNNVFKWTDVHTGVLNNIKEIISREPILGNFDVMKKIVIQSDASKDGLGCCLLQDKPIYHASRSLTSSEKNYSQIEKELLGCTYAVQKFQHLVYGRSFTIVTDNKPLIGIMKKEIGKIASPRLQRLRIKLLKYDINFEFSPGKYMYIADLLSQSYIKDPVSDDPVMSDLVHTVEKYLNITADKRDEFKKETKNDEDLKKIAEYIQQGWPKKFKQLSISLKPYWAFRNNISLSNSLLFMNDRLIVPKSLRNSMLRLLHESHFGITKTQSRAKSIMYWPNMYGDIERMIKSCVVCEKYQKQNCKEPMIAHDVPNIPFSKIAADILYFGGKDYMVVIDYYSKWLEVVHLVTKNSNSIINVLKNIFSTYGVCDELISDNMPFSSYECRQFAKNWGFKITTSSPYYPKSNGLAEKAVGIAKNILRKSDDLCLSLLEYRNTPIIGVGLSPAQLMLNRALKSKLPVCINKLIPCRNDNNLVKEKMDNKKALDKYYYDRNAKERNDFNVGDNVVMLDKNKQWVPARIEDRLSAPRSYIVRDENNKALRRNSTQLKASLNIPNFNSIEESDTVTEDPPVRQSLEESDTVIESPIPGTGRPVRQRRLPSYLNDYVV